MKDAAHHDSLRRLLDRVHDFIIGPSLARRYAWLISFQPLFLYIFMGKNSDVPRVHMRRQVSTGCGPRESCSRKHERTNLSRGRSTSTWHHSRPGQTQRLRKDTAFGLAHYMQCAHDNCFLYPRICQGSDIARGPPRRWYGGKAPT